MFPQLPQAIQNELNQLAQRYGQPLVRIVDLDITSLFDPLTRLDNRYGEVCMVIRRTNGRLLTMKKTFYPAGAYRLPTGGINSNEPILDALLRETYEETGLQVNVNRFLVAVGYRVASKGDTPIFYTFAFLLDETGGTLSPIDEKERVEAFREIQPHELPERVAYFEHLRTSHSQDIDGDWRDWGQFRAIIHRLVWEALEDKAYISRRG